MLIFLFILMQNNTIIAKNHIQQACEAVWQDASEYKIERCVHRGMAAMNDDERERDNELKRLLITSEKDLDICRGKLYGNKK